MTVYIPIVIDFDYERQIGMAESDPDGYGDLLIEMSPPLDLEKLKSLKFRAGVLIDMEESTIKRVAVKCLSVEACDYVA